ncbi:phosphonate metabolism transcriptional regulator PhnF [Hydrogenophaga sp.]|uniref:phosphonate metabolism transcriptional regulator PhnF n=1 Tax=Hydrogenophaga sp. TaxID=1904254 RepID=UPI00272F98C7|nr:phosphonate metabolism transcriptional regulator PhnF [Hydrogenophaga sp.]MDP2015799.1 phosphonate metabolism transcriptional regulator PhnF [Hydrogenophaga sp.]MDP3167477.1 phosphonate metabolism transcriptional regulator PhnF [Hydrogenophaga sp.]
MTNQLTTTIETGEHFWTQIANEIAQAIGQGVYPPGERLPSEHSLAERFGVNRHTIRRSLAALVQRGLVRAEQGSGTYVEDFAVDLAIGKRTRHRQNLAQAGLRGGLVVLHDERVRATADQARALQVAPRCPLLHLLVLGEGAGQPLHVSDRYFPLPRFQGLAEVVRETGSITAAFTALGVTDYIRHESRISARLPDARIAGHLRQGTSRPSLYVTKVNTDMQGLPIEYAETWFAGDRVTLTVNHDGE